MNGVTKAVCGLVLGLISAAGTARAEDACHAAKRNAAVNCTAAVVSAGMAAAGGPAMGAAGAGVAVGVCANEYFNVKNACPAPSPARK